MTAQQTVMAFLRITFIIGSCLILPQYIGFKIYGYAVRKTVFHQFFTLLVPSLLFAFIASALIAVDLADARMHQQFRCGTATGALVIASLILFVVHGFVALGLNIWRKPKRDEKKATESGTSTGQGVANQAL